MKIKQNIYIMYAIVFLQGMVFYAPIAALYRQARGLSMGQIALIESISFLFSLVMELPWGILADKIGYRKTMIYSCGLFFVSKIIFWKAQGFSDFLLERFVLSIAVAGLSGVDVSMLYLSCEKEESQKIFGYYSAFGTAGVLFSSWIYAMFIKQNDNLTALMTMISYGVAALCSFGLKEVFNEKKEKKQSVKKFIFLLGQTVKDRKFLFFLIGMSFYGETVQMITVWLNQNQYLRCGMSEAAIGWAYIVVTVVSLVSVFSEKMTRRLGRMKFALLVFSLSAVGSMVLVITDLGVLSFGSIVIIVAANSLLNPLLSDLYNQHIVTSDRATQLSIFALLEDMVSVGTNLAYGRVVDISLQAAFLLGAAACILAGITFWNCFRESACSLFHFPNR